ncbi:Cis-2,3-dihydrobiphenyl-2,3-diol dehydrogenase [Cyphellophora attinorum]|uniref:Cis-2,3-dihydrobiphenyl-2,3-diol dehydrogenase n=1 Tax=Cyphellophora attinorum TaxID=1664694 RepID=A0A0N1H308_9EURO|nr:Cis-2,3-dihydrobiphenyl-2,3-diol dehydrogenase [Phialophora attinorum]KPI39235.1 Cis-2,3-dihydrobiphenyl-2,3-diol dehydrogenase [Phialophora attinorum]
MTLIAKYLLDPPPAHIAYGMTPLLLPPANLLDHIPRKILDMSESSSSAGAVSSPPVALITGAASGMGLALTRHLVLVKGWRVAMCDVNAAIGENESRKLNTATGTSSAHSSNADANNNSPTQQRTIFRKVDITSYAQQAAFFKEVFEWSGGHIDYFAANAGIMDVGSLFEPIQRMKFDATTDVPVPPSTLPVDVNFRAVLEGIWLYRYFHGQRKRAEKGQPPRGRITVTGSSSGLYPFHGQVQYSATKHAVVGVVRSSAVPLRRENISINALAPSFVATGLLPAQFLRDWPKEHMVSMDNVLRTHDMFIDDGAGERWDGVVGRETATDKSRPRKAGSMMTGEIVELSQEDMFFRRPVAYPNESQRWLNEDSAKYFRDIERQKVELNKAREAKL